MTRETKVRVRFGPSLDDYFATLYVSPVLLNWIFAKVHGGTFVYRIDDTNLNGILPNAFDDFCNGIKWLGLNWDEGVKIGGNYGPYYQSQRQNTYQRFIDQLIQQGKAYWCFCDRERIQALRQQRKDKRLPTRYDRKCRYLTKSEVKKLHLQTKKQPVLRFKTPERGKLFFLRPCTWETNYFAKRN